MEETFLLATAFVVVVVVTVDIAEFFTPGRARGCTNPAAATSSGGGGGGGRGRFEFLLAVPGCGSELFVVLTAEADDDPTFIDLAPAATAVDDLFGVLSGGESAGCACR